MRAQNQVGARHGQNFTHNLAFLTTLPPVEEPGFLGVSNFSTPHSHVLALSLQGMAYFIILVCFIVDKFSNWVTLIRRFINIGWFNSSCYQIANWHKTGSICNKHICIRNAMTRRKNKRHSRSNRRRVNLTKFHRTPHEQVASTGFAC